MISTILRFFASDVIAKGVAVLFIPFFSYLLGPVQLGAFSEWFSLFNIFVALISMGVPSYVLVLLSQSSGGEKRINQKFFRFLIEWFIILSIINYAVYIILSPNVFYGIGLFLSASCFVILNYIGVILRHKKALKKYFVLQLFLVAATSVTPLVFVYYEPVWEARVAGYVAGLFGLVAIVYLLYGRSIKPILISKGFRIGVFSYGSSVVLMSLVTWLKLGADIQFLKAEFGYSSSGIMFFSFQIVSIVSVVAASLNRSSSPAFYKLLHNTQNTEFRLLISRLTMVLCLLAIIVIFAAYLLGQFFLLEFQGSIFLVFPMVIGAVVYGTGQFVSSIFLFHKKPNLLAKCIVMSSVLHPVSSYLLIHYMGWNWIGWSYIVSSLVFILMISTKLRKVRALALNTL